MPYLYPIPTSSGRRFSVNSVLNVSHLNPNFTLLICLLISSLVFYAQTQYLIPQISSSSILETLNLIVVSIERQVLAMVLVAWAASFGLNERGAAADPAAPRYAGLYDVRLEGDGHAMRTDALVSGILSLVDTHGLLRNPTWDGVRLLLLLWPLTQRVQRSLDRIVCLLSITYSALTVI